MLNFPDNPTNGQTFTGPNGAVWSFDGTKWVVSTPSGGGGGGGAAIAVGDTPPGNPVTGTLWFDSAGAQMYLRENDGTSVQWVPVVNQAGSLTLAAATNVGRNLLHNPLFNVQQRGTGSWTTSGNYTADRWVMFRGNDTCSISLVAMVDASRTVIGDEAAAWALNAQFTGSATAGSFSTCTQAIEQARRLGGKTVTVSFTAAANSGTPKLGVSIDQSFGSGGSPSARANGNGQSVTLSTTWTRYSLTFAIPSLSGKTLGTNSDDCTWVNFWFSTASDLATRSGTVGVQTASVFLWGVQLEIGSQATPLEKPDPQQDLAKCQRFFVGTQQTIQWMFTSWGAGAATNRAVSFPVTMRATPTTIVMGTNSGNTNASGANVVNASPWGFDWQITTNAASGAACALTAAGYTASADL